MPRSRFASLSLRSIAAVALLGMAPFVSTPSPASALVAGQAPEYLIEDLGVLPGATASSATGINNAGEVSGYSNDGMFSRTSAVRWSGGTITGLGQFGCGGEGSAISDNRTVVGSSNVTCAEIDVHGFVTSPDGLRDIGSLGGGVPTRAFGINSSDRIVGSSTDDHGNGRAFVSGPGGQFLQSIDALSPDRPAGATAQHARHGGAKRQRDVARQYVHERHQRYDGEARPIQNLGNDANSHADRRRPPGDTLPPVARCGSNRGVTYRT